MMKNINTELIIGLFMIAGFLAFGYLSLQMGEFSIFDLEKNYSLEAEFDNVSGLKVGAGIDIAGVNIGKVSRVGLGEQGLARVTMLINQDIKITADAIASIRTQGLIGDKYIKIIQGADEEMLGEGGVIFDTESAIDFEELVSKYIFQSD
ncbi:MAG: outer membrane lipid asymmetry maintenance protein MlaD [Desulfobulbaceae bacterium]|jgi:phospholipid/cholesterol/gamma-HCH transport system substrate-binding protein|nr:outer membrane lipid asymmetry maintenance protein MlaD [Desulfobulbaceae bacterium]